MRLRVNSCQKYLKRYQDGGFAVFRNVLDKPLLNLIDKHLKQLCREQPGANLYAKLVKNDPFWLSLVADERLLDIAGIFIGNDIALFGANYVVKQANDAKPALWHQDAPNWNLEPLEAITLWIAIDDSTPESGCLKIIPGSHKSGLYELKPAAHPANIFGWQTDRKLVREDNAVDIILKAGDVSVHHPLAIHGSHPNKSKRRRAGMSIRYIPATTRIKNSALAANALLLRGKV